MGLLRDLPCTPGPPSLAFCPPPAPSSHMPSHPKAVFSMPVSSSFCRTGTVSVSESVAVGEQSADEANEPVCQENETAIHILAPLATREGYLLRVWGLQRWSAMIGGR